MKRTFALIALFALVVGSLVTGCNQQSEPAPEPGTNAPAAPATTNQ